MLAGLIWFALVRDLDAMAMLAGLVLSLSLVVSYIKAGRSRSASPATSALPSAPSG